MGVAADSQLAKAGDMQQTAWTLLLVVGFCACATSQPKTQANTLESKDKPSEEVSKTSRKDEASSTSKPAAPSPEAPPKQPAPQPAQDYDLSFRDCQTLGDVYRRAWLADKRKTTRDMNEKQAKLATANFERAAQKAGDNWVQACASTVGAPRIRKHLVCASKARSVQRFNDCLDGKVR